GLMRDARARHQTPRGLAVWIAAARQERAEAPALEQHFLSAILAILGLALGVIAQFRRHVLDEIAIRIARAAEEKSVAADALEQFALPALLAGLARGYAGFVRNHFIVGLGQIDDKFLPKFSHGVTPGQFAFLDFVELFFEPRSEGDIKDVVKTFYQQHADA